MLKKTTSKNNHDIHIKDIEENGKTNQNLIIGEVISTAWNFTKKYFWLVVILFLITIIPDVVGEIMRFIIKQIPGTTEVIMDPMTNMPTTQFIGIWSIIDAVLSILAGIIGAWLGLGYIKANLEILKDKKPALNIMTSASWLQIAHLIGGGILVGLAVLIGIIALILPGIWIAVRLSLFQYYIAEGYSAIDSIKASWAATKNNFWKLFGIGFIYVGIILLGLLALGIGLLWAIPTVALAQAYVYKNLKKNTPTHIKPIH